MKTKPIPNFPAYRIREDSILETNWRTGAFYPGMKIIDKWKPLPKRYNKDGYIPVCLRGDGRQRRTHIHRLMAESFIGGPPYKGACVRHLNGNPKDNSISNLSWGTYKDNENDKILHGTWNTRNGGAKITPEQVIEIRNKIKLGMSHDELAKEYSVSRPTINRIANNKTWRNL